MFFNVEQAAPEQGLKRPKSKLEALLLQLGGGYFNVYKENTSSGKQEHFKILGCLQKTPATELTLTGEAESCGLFFCPAPVPCKTEESLILRTGAESYLMLLKYDFSTGSQDDGGIFGAQAGRRGAFCPPSDQAAKRGRRGLFSAYGHCCYSLRVFFNS